MNTYLLHDDFLDHSKHMISNITKLETEGKKKEAAIAALDFAKFKVAYYEQFVDENAPIDNYKKIHEDDYHYALLNLASARDRCMDFGVFEK